MGQYLLRMENRARLVGPHTGSQRQDRQRRHVAVRLLLDDAAVQGHFRGRGGTGAQLRHATHSFDAQPARGLHDERGRQRRPQRAALFHGGGTHRPRSCLL